MAVSVLYRGHNAAVCLIVGGIAYLWLPTHPTLFYPPLYKLYP